MKELKKPKLTKSQKDFLKSCWERELQEGGQA
jgi:hypothetical protein